MSNCMGSLDAVTWRSLRGWAYVPGQVNLSVEVFADEERIGATVANEFRQDLLLAKIGDGHHAFYFDIPAKARGKKITCRVGNFAVPQPDASSPDPYYQWRSRRKQKLLSGITLGPSRGLEFGALHDPLISPDTPNVKYVDHASTEELQAKYANDTNVDPRELVAVDYVWLDKPLSEVIGNFAPIDYAVALHVAEHVPDLVGWLHQVRSVMRVDGILKLALPDKRYCFDFTRQLTKTSELIEAYLQKPTCPTPAMIYDSRSNAVKRNGEVAWYTWQTEPAASEITPVYTKKEAFDTTMKARTSGEYLDAHCWVFTAESFSTTMLELQTIRLLPFSVEDVDGPDGHEFIATLKAS